MEEGYRGKALFILREANAKVGSKILVKTNDGYETSGLLIPRYQHADEDHIVLKLKSGYNIGIDASEISSISILESPGKSEQQKVAPLASTKNNEKMVLLLSTGGTIASRVDYRTGAVHPALSAEDLYSAVPELGEIATIVPEVVFSTYSENLTPSSWQELSQRIVLEVEKRKPAGVVVMLGTDTLAYVSAALSFSLFGLSIPVVCVGAQRSSDRPSSDSALNLGAAVRFASFSSSPGVFVAMHADESDDAVAIHCGTRVRKNHTSRRDAFESIDVPLVAKVIKKGEISFFLPERKQVSAALESTASSSFFRLKTKFEDSVALLKFYPGFDENIIPNLVSSGVRGMIIEGTGLGHVSSRVVKMIASFAENGPENRVFFGITSQCIWGRVDLNVYETGRDLVNAGAVPLGDMLGETAFAKLSWALGNFPRDRVNEIMLTNIADEITSRSPAG